MSPTSHRRRPQFFILFLLTILALSFFVSGVASANDGPYNRVPGYPKYGCYDIATSGIGMWNGASPYWLQVDVPGPVVDAQMFWIGTEDVGAPDSPNQSDLTVGDGLGSTVNPTTVLGKKVDFVDLGSNEEPWYMWRADIGPNGYNIIQQGTNKFPISGWAFPKTDGQRRNGVGITVVYSTGNCERPNQVEILDSMDWYWERWYKNITTYPIVYTFPPAPVDREATVWLHKAGTDSTVRVCRHENIWAATGSGTPPTSIVDIISLDPAVPPVPVNGGKLVVKDGFTLPGCPISWYPPVTDLLGWQDGFGFKSGTNGFISPQWAILRLKIKVPAGQTWLAVQGESVRTDPNTVDVTESGESGAWTGQFVIPLYNPELKVTKSVSATEAVRGDTLTYTLAYDNHGYGVAENSTIVDKLPDHVSYVSASNGGVYDNATRTVTWNLGTLAIGQTGQVTLVVKADPVFEPGVTPLTNTATISTTTGGETDTSDNTSSVTTNITAQAELSIAKEAAPEPVDAGTSLTYTVDWTVGGNAYAHGVTIVDTLPDKVTVVDVSDGGVYDPVKHTVTWTLGDVTPVTADTYTILTNVASPQYNGTKLTNKVAISDAAGDKAQATVVSTIRSSHVLAIEKLAAPEPVEAGDDLTYTVNWAVTGNEPAKDATVVDTLPMSVTFKSATGGGVYDPATHTVTWNLGELMTPKDGSFTVVVNVPAPQYNGAQLTNTVDFQDETPGSTPAQTTTTSTIHADHQLMISKADSPDPVVKGTDLTYTITWSVTGNEYADKVIVTDPVPFGTKFVSASNGGTYDPATNTVTWNVGDKVPGDTGSVVMVVTVNKDFPNGLDITNQATVTDYKAGKEGHGDATTQVVQTPEGAIGDTVWYDLNANSIQEPGEPGIAGVGLVLYDAGPDGNCGTSDDVAKANAVTDANGKYRFDMVPAGTYCVAVLDATLPTGLTLVSGTNPHGPIVLAEGQVYRDADFGYQTSTQVGAIGDRVWSDANGNGIQDPGEVGIGNVTLDLIKAGANGQCDAADATVAASTTTTGNGSYLFSGLMPAVYCVKVTDSHGVLTGWSLTGGTNPTAPITLAAGQTYLNADFGYQSPTTAGQIGDLVFYDANRNGLYEPAAGERGIGGVTLSLLAADTEGKFTIVVATTTTASDGSYLFTGLPDGQYQVVVTDLNGRLLGYTQTYGLPNTDNNGQVSPFTVTIAGGASVLYADFAYADGHLLSVTKTDNVPTGTPVEAGADMIYTISFGASGREPAPNVVLKDPLPMQLDFIEASNGGTYDPVTRLVTWNLGNLNPGDTSSVTLKVHVKKPLPNNSFIFNTVTIVDDAKVMDEATDVVRVHAVPILALTKTADPTGTVAPGDTIKYTLCYSNTGNGNATGVLLQDAIPTLTTVVPGSYPVGMVYDPAARTLTLPVGVLAPDATACVDFQVKVDLDIPGVTETPQNFTVHNVAHLASNELTSLTAETSNTLSAFVKPTLTKTATPSDSVKPGDTITYNLCYANEGNANLTGVALTDVIPGNTTYVPGSATGTGITYNESTQTLSWAIGTLGPNANACVTFKVTVNMTIDGLTGQAGSMTFAEWNALAITNTATLESDQVADKTATATIPLNATVDPAIYKSVDSPIRHVGETVVFTVTVTNRGTANATDVVLSDVISTKLENVTLTTSKGTPSYDATTRQWTVNVGVLAPNETVTVNIKGMTVRQTPPYQIVNTAVVAFKEGAARQSNTVTVDVVYFFPGEIPEASTWLMLGTGLAGLAGYARLRMRTRRRKTA